MAGSLGNGFLGPTSPVNAGGVAGARALYGAARRVYGVPQATPTGFTNAQEAAKHRQTVAGSPPGLPQIDPTMACLIEYLCRCLPRALVEELVSVQQPARGPSHIEVPFSATCLDLVTGTGGVGTPNAPITVAPSAPGVFTDIVTFTVPQRNRAEIKGWGTFTDPIVANPFVEWRIRVNGRVQPPFDGFWGTGGAAGASGTKWGSPWGIADPNRDICIHLQQGQTVALEARVDPLAGGPVDVGGRLLGWSYLPYEQTSDGTMRGTITDVR
ncbi:MAG TPA: hypothetical protein VFH61_06780 [Thermoleophilia bacterium]|nr:hypothetical protein [Thermoleophilia bacterium]